jgi:signal transduction histidine kinase
MQKKNAYNETKFKTSLDAAYDQILFLSKMVNDLSTLSRAERGVADTPEDINVKELLTSLYAEYMPQARAAGLSFDLDLHHHLRDIHVSRLYVTELLQNLITNAIKYTKEGGVTLGATQHGRHITFSVKDTGIGIGKSDQKKVYDKFYRSEDYRTRETRGTGLGLYVSTKLARKMDTFIALKSRINHGSEFSFDIETK